MLNQNTHLGEKKGFIKVPFKIEENGKYKLQRISKCTSAIKSAAYSEEQGFFLKAYSSLEAKISQDWLYLVKHFTQLQ